MPIAITLRKEFSASSYRDTFVRALRSQHIDSVYVASGFFRDFTGKLDLTAPDFGIGEEMEGKRVFLMGGYEEDSVSLLALRDALKQRGLDAHVSRLTAPERGAQDLRWHAKVAIFLSQTRPVLAIVGSSNFTGPSMYGGSEWKYTKSPDTVQVEGDSFYWLEGHMDASQTMHDAFHYWGGGRLAPHIAFNHKKYDDEIEKLICRLWEELLRFEWEHLR